MYARLLPLLFLSVTSVTFSRESTPFVQTHHGGVVGTIKESFSGRKYQAFEGIPYALPPVEKRRFQPPQPVEKWSGNLTATKLPSPCMQYIHAYFEDRVIGDEDCLYLNIYVPMQTNSNRSLPVLFGIHGGAFQFGFALNGVKFLMDKDVIHVGINYRVGPFGFLSTEDAIVPGNMGLKDQSLALRWVSENIHYFGGDPKRITLIGNSAGGASVHFHYLSPMSKGLFQNGLSFSGTAFGPGKMCENSREKALELADVMGCPTDSVLNAIECLRYRPPRVISAAAQHFMPWLYNPFTPFGPVVEKGSDKPFIDRSPIEIISSGDAADLPWIAGVVSEEGLYPVAEFVNSDEYLEDLDKNWEIIAPHLLDYNYTIPLAEHAEVARKIRNHYFGTMPINKKTTKELISVVGDRLYVADSEKAARVQAKANKSPVFFWYYSYRARTSESDYYSNSTNNYGVSHCDDINLIFENDIIDSSLKPRDREMQVKLIDFIVSVAEKGEPDLGLYFEWKRVDPNKKELDFLHIAGPEVMKMESKPDLAQKQFWSSIDFDENKSKH